MSDVPRETPLESGMATGNDEGEPGEHPGFGAGAPGESASSVPDEVMASDEVVAAVDDDAPLPAEGGDEGDPDTPVFREP